MYSISTAYMNPELQSSTHEYIATFLSATDAETKRGSKTEKLMGGLISDLTRDAIAKCECWLVSDIDTAEGSTKNTAFTGLYSLLQHCGDTVFEDATLAQVCTVNWLTSSYSLFTMHFSVWTLSPHSPQSPYLRMRSLFSSHIYPTEEK